MENSYKETRNPVFDIMKGLGILLVMVGHIPSSAYISLGEIDGYLIADAVQRVFTPFRMPMFFLLAGFFTKPIQDNTFRSQFSSIVKKRFRRLLVPYFASYILLIGWSCIPALLKQNYHMPLRHFLSTLWGGVDFISSQTFEQYFGGLYITYMWFLLALFWGSILLFILSYWRNHYVIISFIISIGAILLHPYTRHWMPWCVMQGLCAIQFLAIGHWLRTHHVPKWIWYICIASWLLAIRYSGISMANNEYHCYPLDILAGLGGSYCLYLFAKVLNKLRYCRAPLVKAGIISLPILCFHEIEPFTDIFNSIRIHSRTFIAMPDIFWVLMRYICVIGVAFMATKVPGLKKIYS